MDLERRKDSGRAEIERAERESESEGVHVCPCVYVFV